MGSILKPAAMRPGLTRPSILRAVGKIIPEKHGGQGIVPNDSLITQPAFQLAQAAELSIRAE